MRRFVIEKPTSIVKFTRSIFPHTTQSMLRRAMRQKDFRVNGVRVGSDAPLSPGDELCIYIDDKYLFPSIPVLYEDENILCVQKPQGMESTGALGVEGALCALRNEPVYPAHRLDAMTGGALLFAKSESVQALLFDAFSQHLIRKTYLCITVGIPSKTGHLTHFLKKDAGAALVRAYDTPVPGARTAILEYAMLRHGSETALVQVKLFTGRTHQIRVQMAQIGCPLAGDDKYGDRAWNRVHGTRLLLWSQQLVFAEMPKELAYLNGLTIESPAPFAGDSLL